ncbi:MAG: ABC transporter permease, partial [Aggregatilineales bacterium]
MAVTSMYTADEQKIAMLQERPSVWRRARISLVRAKWPLLAILILVFMCVIALIGPQIAPKDPNRQDLLERLKEPGASNRAEDFVFVLGSDAIGRDVFSRLIYGTRVSIAVGFVAVAIGGTMGTILGLTAGFFGGFVDDLIMRIADIQLAFPFILLAIMVLVVLGSGVLNLIVVLGVGQWVTYARISRGETISQR